MGGEEEVRGQLQQGEERRSERLGQRLEDVQNMKPSCGQWMDFTLCLTCLQVQGQ